ncbi:hypothetical protein B0T14DRAFT_507068 [Immersiella caudata]|uniref:Secreted protein n=1 Tax=Immersiella caudata TaxID=314043 RepID=A0AA39XGD7_9PEZI|nr:hypothetical protein B0T14DRAFT_507068 [Immersiella caudata]
MLSVIRSVSFAIQLMLLTACRTCRFSRGLNLCIIDSRLPVCCVGYSIPDPRGSWSNSKMTAVRVKHMWLIRTCRGSKGRTVGSQKAQSILSPGVKHHESMHDSSATYF